MRQLLLSVLALAILIPALRVVQPTASYAQSISGVGIGTATPHAAAILDIDFTDRGVLFPRMTTAQRDAIGSPAGGLLIYNTDDKVLQIYDGSTWQSAAS